MAMTDQQYLASSTHVRPGTLPGKLPASTPSSSSADHPPPKSSAYSDLATSSFGSTSSFGRPQHCDSSILTPISSGAGSPPLRQRSHPARRYQSAAISPNHPQSLTPPPTSKMYWSNDFDMAAAATSQSASPLAIQSMSSQAHFHLSALSDASAEQHLKEEIPDPPEPYWGSFGVSTTQPEGVTAPEEHMHHHAYYVDSMQHHMGHVQQTLAPSALVVKQEHPEMSHMEMQHQQEQQHQHHPHHQHNQHNHPHHQHIPQQIIHADDAAIMDPSTPQDLQVIAPRSPVPEDADLMGDFPANFDPPIAIKYRRSMSQQQESNRLFRKPRVRGSAARHAGMGPGRGSASTKAKHSSSSAAIVQAQPASDQEAGGTTSEPLQFKDGMPEADRFLFELRRKYDNNKGKGMWDPITREYNERFKTQFDRAALQMRISRAKSKYVQWGEKDDKILIEAARQVERQYYRQVHIKYKELGGNPQADFNVGNVEMRMVELGLSDVFMEPWKGDTRMSTRRRRKLNERQRNTAANREEVTDRGQDASAAPQQQAFLTHHHHHYAQQSMAPAAARSSAYPAELSPRVREQVLREIDERQYDMDSGEGPADNMDDVLGEGHQDDRDAISGQQHSSRVARQAYDDMIRTSGNGISQKRTNGRGKAI